MKRLWQTLLPGTPIPVCGTAEDDKPDAGQNATPKDGGRDKEALKKQIGR
jgi:hypothetical protein